METTKHETVPTVSQSPKGVEQTIETAANQAILVDNPLRYQTRAEARTNAKHFHERHELGKVVDEDVFIRAALVAMDPDAYMEVEGLTEIERRALDEEQSNSFWQNMKSLTKEFRVLLLTCCLAAVVQGWDQSSINGANLGWPREFGLTLDFQNPRAEGDNIWIFGLVNSGVWFSAALLGCWLTDPLNEYVFGRRGAIFIAGLFSFATVIGAAFAVSWQSYFICRLLLGIGIGAKSSIVPVYLAESANSNIRGSLVISWQLFVALGLVLGHAANLVVFPNWRWQVAAAFIPAVPLLVLVPFCYESPRWLLKKGKFAKAYDSLHHTRQTPLQACRDLYHMHTHMQHETRYFMKTASSGQTNNAQRAEGVVDSDEYQDRVSHSSYTRRFLQLFTQPRIRRASTAAIIVMIAQQLCGINILAFLSSTIVEDLIRSESRTDSLDEAGLNRAGKEALWVSFGLALTNFLFTFLAWKTIDTKGRRFLLNLSFPNMAWTLLAAGLCFLIEQEKLRLALVVFFLLLFTIAYAPGEGPVPFTLSSEVFPLINREVGMSFAVFWNFLGAGILALTVPWLVYALEPTGLLGLFACLNLVSWLLVFLLVPETAGVGLEELNYIFQVSTKKHMQYRIDVVKWGFNRYIRRRDAPQPAPLYIWIKDRQKDQGRRRRRRPSSGERGAE